MKSLMSCVLTSAVLSAALLTAPATATAAETPRARQIRLAVPGVTATGTYSRTRLAVTVAVTPPHTCGILQLATGGAGWRTVAALCGPGAATIRTEVRRPPSIRLCNGDSLALAEGVDCDRVTTRV